MWWKWDTNPDSGSKTWAPNHRASLCLRSGFCLSPGRTEGRTKNTRGKVGPTLCSLFLITPRASVDAPSKNCSSSHSQQLAPWFCPSLPLSCPCLDFCSSLLAVTLLRSFPHTSTHTDTHTETVIFLKCESGLVTVPKPRRDPHPNKRFLTRLAVSAPTLCPAQRMER